MLPAAAMLSLLLLLSSLSVQAVSLQGELLGSMALRQQEAEDRLASAAQVLVASIQTRHACLLALPLELWPTAACGSAAELAQLQQGEVLGSRWQLRRWQPESVSRLPAPAQQRLTFELALLPRAVEPSLRWGFELRLLSSPWRVQELHPLGPRGSAP